MKSVNMGHQDASQSLKHNDFTSIVPVGESCIGLTDVSDGQYER